MRGLGHLAVRVTAGGLLAAHGAQKLAGWFGGPGLQGTAGMLESQGLRPARSWAPLAALSETVGGGLTALGLFSPVGPIVSLAPMAIAAGTVHRGKPIWAYAGGAELPLTNIAVALDQAIEGPGPWSLDRLFGIRVPRPLVAALMAATSAGVAAAVAMSWASSQAPAPDEQPGSAQRAAGLGDAEADGRGPVLGEVPSAAGSRA
jgi:putative oxidoreductase